MKTVTGSRFKGELRNVYAELHKLRCDTQINPMSCLNVFIYERLTWNFNAFVIVSW